MPNNPNRSTQGGDVSGETKTDVTMGKPIDVAAASYDPGYSLDTTLSQGYVNKADLMTGYCEYGKAVGEKGK